MNFSLYIFGTPDGYDQYPLDSNSAKFQEVLSSCESVSQLSVFRNDQLIQYVYVRRIPGNQNLFLGFALVVTGVYCINCHSLNSLFDNAFNNVLLKEELFRFEKNKYNYRVARFADNINEIKCIKFYFKSTLENEFDGLFVTIPSSFCAGNGQFSTSMKQSASEINSAIEFFDIVHITNGEKIVSSQEVKQPHPKKTKRWVLWLLLAVFILSGTALTYKIIHWDIPKAETDNTNIQFLKDTYKQAVEDFNRKSGYIVQDMQGNVGVQDHVIDAFKALQTIERCESDSLFTLFGESCVFKDKLQLFREKLFMAKNKINDMYNDDFENGIEDPHVDKMRDRLKYIDYVIEQTSGNSVLDVQIIPNTR